MNQRCFFIDSINKTVNFIFSKTKNQYLENIIKRLDFNCRWNSELGQWIVPINKFTKNKILSVISQHNFKQIALKVEEDVNINYSRDKVDYAYLKGLCDAKGFTYIPRDYQLEALGYCREKGNVINGDDVGVGKTFEAIMYAETTNSFPCLVVVPSSVKYNWFEKWREITNNKRSVSVIEATPKKSAPNNWRSDVVIINYNLIGKKQGKGSTVKFKELLAIKWKMNIFDEAHFLKDKKSQRSIGSRMITKKSDDVIIQLLTGTAVMSRPVELWNLLKLVKRDDRIANSWFQFVRRYCGGYRGKFGWVTDGATNIIELNRRLRETCYIRREKKDVLKELPNVNKQIIKVPISNKKDIEKATTDFIQFIRETKGEEKAEKAMEAEQLVAIGVLRKLAIEGKLKGLEQYLKDWQVTSSKKLLIFGIHREPLEYLSKKFKSDLIIGGVSAEKKQQIIKNWQKNSDIFLFANMETGGTGVDGLQNVCSDMLIIELPWRPSDLAQTIGRLDRSGQDEFVVISYMLSFETIDKEIWEMLETKEQVTEAVNKGIDITRQKSGLKTVIQKFLKK